MPLGRIKLLVNWHHGYVDGWISSVCATDVASLRLMLAGAMVDLSNTCLLVFRKKTPMMRLMKSIPFDRFKYGRHIDVSGNGPTPNRH